MTTYSIPRMWTVGFDQFFDRIESAPTQQSYPPHNVIKHSDDKFEIAIAVAGFGSDDIDITLEKSQLTIEGKDTSSKEVQYIHKGISTRKFRKTFTLAEYVIVKEAELNDGILSIILEKDIPEEEKPRKISIGKKQFLSE